ncbi:MAG: hypothetical protein JXA11_15485 [Phycisphaerae bacterium]|nr:hypothetical protein [Phycisphaerae bacterium]
MAITATKKAAMLLMRLDPGSASELLKAVQPDTATEIATEMAYLNSSGGAMSEEEEQVAQNVVQEFGTLLSGSDSDWSLGFVRQMLESAMSAEQSAQAFEKVKQSLDYRDPFASIRETKLHELSAALEGEPPQVVSLVLAELPAKSSAELLGMFEEKVSHQIIRGMAGATNVPVEAKVRVASVIKKRLQELRTSGGASEGNAREGQIRKVSVLLRGLAKDARDQMIASIKEQDPETGAMVMKMMVVWDDLPILNDRALQEALRASDPRKLALALVNVDKHIADKIKMNLSETGRNMLYEESLLLTAPKPKAIVEARDLLLQDLRELNEAGMLEFEEG